MKFSHWKRRFKLAQLPPIMVETAVCDFSQLSFGRSSSKALVKSQLVLRSIGRAQIGPQHF
jgi:hypothetical protein